MIKIENTEVFGFEAAVRGMRNPMNSWDKSDSHRVAYDFSVGDADLKLMKQLILAGTDHSKFMRMINVSCDIVAPMYWWKEFDTYKVGTVRNSCSTMHKIHAKEFEYDDFSHDYLFGFYAEVLEFIVKALNKARKEFLKTNDKRFWWHMIQLLPSSYNQRATVQMNYQVLRGLYKVRKNHKLDEWRDFCKWVETLPYSELITE
jgi:hypothetical protein